MLLCSISVPSMASKNLLVTAGNLAQDGHMQISFLGMHAAAAGLALAERKWFHISKARASRCNLNLLPCTAPACVRASCQRAHDRVTDVVALTTGQTILQNVRDIHLLQSCQEGMWRTNL